MTRPSRCSGAGKPAARLAGLRALQPRRRAGRGSNRLAGRRPAAGRRRHACSQTNEELLALKDKANLALGFAYLQANKPALAKPFLERVRLNGAQSTRALLGLGWADAALGNYRGRADAVAGAARSQPARCRGAGVIPGRSLCVRQARRQWPGGRILRTGTDVLQPTKPGASTSPSAASATASCSTILLGEAGGKTPQRGWFWQLQEAARRAGVALPVRHPCRQRFPGRPEELPRHGVPGSTLERWDENMIVYDAMIETREQAYAERMPQTDALLASDALGTLADASRSHRGRLNEIVGSEDVAALGTAEQRDAVAAHRAHRSRDRLGPRQPGTGGAARQAAPDQGRAVLGPAQIVP